MQGTLLYHDWGTLQDPEVGRDNPAELKAQKLARSFTRGVVDRSLRPDTEDKRRIQDILRLAPNRCLSAKTWTAALCRKLTGGKHR